MQVQDKALDILSHHMQGNADVCIAHLPMIQIATKHNATSVRKRAVDILWDCYINAPAIAERNRSLVTRLVSSQLHMFDGALPCASAPIHSATPPTQAGTCIASVGVSANPCTMEPCSC